MFKKKFTRQHDIDSFLFFIRLYNFPLYCFDPWLVLRLLACGCATLPRVDCEHVCHYIWNIYP